MEEYSTPFVLRGFAIQMNFTMEWDVSGINARKLFDELGTFRSRPDQRHLATQDVPELRQFVETRLAQKTPDRSHSRIRLSRELGSILLRVDSHRAELVERERSTVILAGTSVAA